VQGPEEPFELIEPIPQPQVEFLLDGSEVDEPTSEGDRRIVARGPAEHRPTERWPSVSHGERFEGRLITSADLGRGVLQPGHLLGLAPGSDAGPRLFDITEKIALGTHSSSRLMRKPSGPARRAMLLSTVLEGLAAPQASPP